VRVANKEDLVKAFRNTANEAIKDIIVAFTKLVGEVVLIIILFKGRKALKKRKE